MSVSDRLISEKGLLCVNVRVFWSVYMHVFENSHCICACLLSIIKVATCTTTKACKHLEHAGFQSVEYII
jgi:hypothetical protein